ncbi:hypothetical protein Dip510_000821 [Elusimicrobium posterum]|uniref:hypothetical protein n=1 Tax=Elusimicrobium posterum TaxID=3116653 RepID=UPI003C750F9E
MEYIYFDKNKVAHAYEIAGSICKVDAAIWAKHAAAGNWDIVDGNFIVVNPPEPEPLEKIERLERDYNLPRPVRDIFITIHESGLPVPEKVLERVMEIEDLVAQAESLRKEDSKNIETENIVAEQAEQ